MQERNPQEIASAEIMSVEDLFLGAQESFSEAHQRAIEENKSFAKTEFFRMDKLGTYRLRILPIAPHPDGHTDRRSYEYPVRQLLMSLDKPDAIPGKTPPVYVTVTRATDAGLSVDLIDTYRQKAVETAKDMGEEKLAEKIAGGSFGGGLKYNYGHSMYILDLAERAAGIQLLTLSHSQFKELDERKFKLWEKKLAKNQSHPCPISSVYNAYPVEIEKKKNGGKTEYYISIDNESDNDILSKEELNLLMNQARLPEIIYRYSRYHYEATQEFLKQCDQRYGLKVMETEEMQQAIAQIGIELPKEDTSSFSFDKRAKDSKNNSEENKLSLDALLDRYEELEQQSIGDKTEEGQALRAQIRTYIEEEKLPIRMTRSTTNGQLLDMIEAELSGDGESMEPEADSEENLEPVRRRR